MWTHIDVPVLDETDRERHFVTDTSSCDRCHPGAKNVSLSIKEVYGARVAFLRNGT